MLFLFNLNNNVTSPDSTESTTRRIKPDLFSRRRSKNAERSEAPKSEAPESDAPESEAPESEEKKQPALEEPAFNVESE